MFWDGFGWSHLSYVLFKKIKLYGIFYFFFKFWDGFG
jgi:hypothetical protein